MGVFSLAGWSRRIRAGFLVSRVTQDTATPRRTSRRGLSPAAAELSRTSRSSYAYDIAVLQPHRRIATPLVWALPRSLATTGGITFCFLFLEVLRCFSSLGWRHRNLPTAAVLQTAGLSHSEIPGSEVICTYPGLIAAYHVLHRLHEPRHPPCALYYFRFPAKKAGRSYFQLFLASSIGHAGRSFLLLQSCLCQYVKDLFPKYKGSVENIGVEPMTSCMPCKRSSQLS